MLKETVKAPNFLSTSMVTKNATEVHKIPKNNNHKKSERVIEKNEAFIFPWVKITPVRATRPMPISCKEIAEEDSVFASSALKIENKAAHIAEPNPYNNARNSLSEKSSETM